MNCWCWCWCWTCSDFLHNFLTTSGQLEKYEWRYNSSMFKDKERCIHFHKYQSQVLDWLLDLPRVFRVGHDKYEGQWLVLLADHPLDGPVQLVGVALVEVEGRYSEVLPHQARHVHVVQRDGGHLPGGGQEFRNEGRSDQIGGSTTVLGQA